MNKLLQIDELTHDDHKNLSTTDNCYYIMEYTAGKDHSYSTANQLILNFKKPVKYKNTLIWQYKLNAINEVALILRECVIPRIAFETTTLVPIPPSKHKLDPLYDNRVMEVIKQACSGRPADIRDLLKVKHSTQSSHSCKAGERPSINDLQENMELETPLCQDLKEKIILFDDVLTTGAHFCSCKNLILKMFPNTIIIGVFIARVQRQSSDFTLGFTLI